MRVTLNIKNSIFIQLNQSRKLKTKSIVEKKKKKINASVLIVSHPTKITTFPKILEIPADSL